MIAVYYWYQDDEFFIRVTNFIMISLRVLERLKVSWMEISSPKGEWIARSCSFKARRARSMWRIHYLSLGIGFFEGSPELQKREWRIKDKSKLIRCERSCRVDHSIAWKRYDIINKQQGWRIIKLSIMTLEWICFSLDWLRYYSKPNTDYEFLLHIVSLTWETIAWFEHRLEK